MEPSELRSHLLTLLLGALLLLCCQSLSADLYSSDEICFLNKEKGLSGESVSKIITDSNGQVWMLTSYGVNRYNGKRVEHFRIQGSDSHLWASDICLGGAGEVYLACREGLYVLRRGHDVFTKVKVDVSSPENLLYADHRLYIGCHDGLYVYDGSVVKHVTVAPPRWIGQFRQAVHPSL